MMAKNPCSTHILDIHTTKFQLHTYTRTHHYIRRAIFGACNTSLLALFNIHSSRQLFAMYASHYIIGLSSEDIIYCHLPLYHSSGTFFVCVINLGLFRAALKSRSYCCPATPPPPQKQRQKELVQKKIGRNSSLVTK